MAMMYTQTLLQELCLSSKVLGWDWVGELGVVVALCRVGRDESEDRQRELDYEERSVGRWNCEARCE